MDVAKIIIDIENLIKLISKSGSTISDKKAREIIEKWVANYYSDLSEILSFDSKANETLKYLFQTINNQRLTKKKWLSNLRIIKKSLSKLKFSGKKQILIFDPNKPFTAYQILKKIFSRAKKEILIYDGYVTEGTLDILVQVGKGVRIQILTNNTYGKFLKELSKFKKEFTNSEVRKSLVVHDRFFFIDGKCFISGISLHALGGKKSSHVFQISKDIANILKSHLRIIWNQANKIL